MYRLNSSKSTCNSSKCIFILLTQTLSRMKSTGKTLEHKTLENISKRSSLVLSSLQWPVFTQPVPSKQRTFWGGILGLQRIKHSQLSLGPDAECLQGTVCHQTYAISPSLLIVTLSATLFHSGMLPQCKITLACYRDVRPSSVTPV